jgi:DNA topoisomerase-1
MMQHDNAITRQRHGKGFAYYNNGRLIKDKTIIAYCRKLAVPPAWQNVEISQDANQKILATGIDGAGRHQAIYHPDFRAAQDKAKFERILVFGKKLPKLRQQIHKDLARKKLGKAKVVACIVKLMDEAYFRIGNVQYAKANQHYGITTLRSKHANITSTSVTFDFVGKSGQQQRKRISDRQLAGIIKQLDDLPGYEIFKYVGEDGKVHDIQSRDVNEYIKTHMGEAYSAKDFRTWGGSLLAAAELATIKRSDNERERKKVVTTCIKDVAKRLGNTAAVTRSSYIDPRIIDAFSSSDDLAKVWQSVSKHLPDDYMTSDERCVLQLLRQTV